MQALGIPVSFYQLGNVVDADLLGTHHYNDSAFNAIGDLLGLGSEHLGLIYTHRGEFIDIAYVRDTADETQKQFDGIDGDWWDSQRRVPEKFLVLKRDDATGTQLSPTGFQRVGITCA